MVLIRKVQKQIAPELQKMYALHLKSPAGKEYRVTNTNESVNFRRNNNELYFRAIDVLT